MSLFAQLEEKLKQALIDRDSETIDVLKLVKSPILLQAKELGFDSPSDEICQTAIYKQIKAYEEIADLYRQRGEQSLADQPEREIRILEELLPAQLGQSDLASIIDEVVSQADLGLEMRNFKTLLDMIADRVGASASRGQIAQLLREKITADNV